MDIWEIVARGRCNELNWVKNSIMYTQNLANKNFENYFTFKLNRPFKYIHFDKCSVKIESIIQ